MVKIAMCDDDVESLKVSAKILESAIMEQDFNAEIVTVTTDQNKILNEIKNQNIDILFLDVDFQNSGKNGLEFASELRKINKDFYLIFLSGHQRYMHVSFYVKVFDYLVKPITKDVFNEVVKRLKDDIDISKKLFVHLNKWKSVRNDVILYIERQNNKTIVVTNYGIETTSKNLETLLKELPPNFAKCHRSYIVNLNNIISLDKKEGVITFSNGKTCPVNSHFSV